MHVKLFGDCNDNIWQMFISKSMHWKPASNGHVAVLLLQRYPGSGGQIQVLQLQLTLLNRLCLASPGHLDGPGNLFLAQASMILYKLINS